MFNLLTLDTDGAKWDSEVFFQHIINWLQTSGLKLLLGLIALFILFSVVNAVARGVKRGMERRKHDKTITQVVVKLIKYGAKLVLFLIFLGYVGIDTAGIGTIIASISVAIGLAVQGSLANLAGWFIIIIMRPFRLGDYIEAQGQGGTVEEIKVFYTYIVTTDNRLIMIPNGALANGNIVNTSIKDTRRVENTFTISHSDNAGLAMRLIDEIIIKNELILKQPEQFIRISNFTSNGIEIVVRVWTKRADYWTVYFAMLDSVKKEFDANGITIPYSQIDVHMIEKSDKK